LIERHRKGHGEIIMIQKNFDDITKADIDYLVENKIMPD